MPQRYHDGEGQMDSGDEIGQRHRRVGRRPARLGVEIGESAEPLGQCAEAGAAGIRAGLTETGHRADDQTRVLPQQILLADAELLQGAGRMFSMITSAWRIRSTRTRRPSGTLRFRVIGNLLRPTTAQKGWMPRSSDDPPPADGIRPGRVFHLDHSAP